MRLIWIFKMLSRVFKGDVVHGWMNVLFTSGICFNL